MYTNGAVTAMVYPTSSRLTSGKLLSLMMDQFLKYNTGDADHEVIQCMLCLFGISVSVSSSLAFSLT